MKKLVVLVLALAVALVPTAASAEEVISYTNPDGSVTTKLTVDIPDFTYPAYGGCHYVTGTLTSWSIFKRDEDFTVTGNIVGPSGTASDFVYEEVGNNASTNFDILMCANMDGLGVYTLHGTVDREIFGSTYTSKVAFTETFRLSKARRAAPAFQPWKAKRCKKVVRAYYKAVRKHQTAKAKRLRARGNRLGCAE